MRTFVKDKSISDMKKLTDNFLINIPDQKIIGYLLSSTHKLGSLKAAYFLSYGFTLSLSNEFIRAIKVVVENNVIISETKKEYGVIYLVDGPINSPNGKILLLRTVWIVEKGDKIARLVTVYPK
jgi:hypothetical protein